MPDLSPQQSAQLGFLGGVSAALAGLDILDRDAFLDTVQEALEVYPFQSEEARAGARALRIWPRVSRIGSTVRSRTAISQYWSRRSTSRECCAAIVGSAPKPGAVTVVAVAVADDPPLAAGRWPLIAAMRGTTAALACV